MKKFPSRESGRLMARALKRLQIRRATLFTTLFAVLLSTFTFVNQSPARADTAGTGACTQTFTKTGTGDVTVSEVGGYCYAAFRNTGAVGTQTAFSWTRPTGINAADVLVIGGGGGGGSRHGGGGGAGSFVEALTYNITSATTVAINVGAGGAGGTTTNLIGSKGSDSSFKVGANGLTALGGGGGLNGSSSTVNGGSGGGAGANQTFGTVTSQAQTKLDATSLTGIAFGNSGAAGADEFDGATDYWAAGGGGGAGAAGARPTSNNVVVASTFSNNSASIARGGNGGVGKAVSWISTTLSSSLGIGQISSTSVFFSGGGGGGIGNDGAAGGTGGTGGGATGTRSQTTISSATAHTGGGGGGGGYDDISPAAGFEYNGPGGNGGSGVVVIRYALTGEILRFDATNPDSYTSGTTWNDLAGAKNASLVNGTSFNSRTKAFDFDGTNDYVDLPDLTNDLSNGFAIHFVADLGAANSYERVFEFSSSGTAGSIALSRLSTTNRLILETYNSAGTSATWCETSGDIISSGFQSYSVVVQPNGTCQFYRNGVTFTTTGSAPYATNVTRTENYLGVARGPSGYAPMAIQSFVMYNTTQVTPVCRPYETSTSTHKVLQFTTVGQCLWNVPSGAATSTALVVAGGGGGGGGQASEHGGGGGGAGGLVTPSLTGLSGQLTLTVGQGGSGGTVSGGNGAAGSSGGNSSISTSTATGGGGGGSYFGNGPSGGGSGGGAGNSNDSGKRSGASGSQGNAGGSVSASGSQGTFAAGGGGAGGAGASVTTTPGAVAAGGVGATSSITGTSTLYAGGGGGGGSTSGGAGGNGGGGNGGRFTSGAGEVGAASFGGGGGGGMGVGGANANPGGAGGSGIVIVSYALPAQSALSVTSTTGYLGATLSLTTSGGTGGGAVTYAVNNAGTTGCSVTGSTLSYTSAGTCTVTATKASADGYAVVSSSATAVTITSLTVTYDSKGGPSVSSGTFLVGGSITEPTTPVRSGYTFGGWSATDGGTAVTWPYSPGGTSNITLYAKWTASQTVDSSLELAGTVGQYAQISDGQILPATGAFTIQAWLKAPTDTSSNGTGMVFSQGPALGSRFYLYRNSQGLLVYDRGGASSTALCGTAPANTWQHVTITYNGTNTSTCYLNGAQQSTLVANNSIGTKFVVGALSYAMTDRAAHWKGSIDDVRVYNNVRTGTQIAADAHTYATVADSSLIAYYDFNEGSGTTAFNQKYGASSATNLTLSGSPTFADVAESSTVNGRTVKIFKRSYLNNTGGWTVPGDTASLDVLAVGGGGAGGSANEGAGGGGGGGRVLTQTGQALSGVLGIKIGQGGVPVQAAGASPGGDGGSTSISPTSGSAISALGGSGGATGYVNNTQGVPSNTGYNGGGGSVWATSLSSGSAGLGGFSGGNPQGSGVSGDVQYGGGGGGAAANGANGSAGGGGGAGVSNAYATGSNLFYGGGGGGGKRSTTGGTGGAGGSSVGGAGGTSVDGSPASVNTGSGGGGAGGNAKVGGSGAAGIVVIRYGLESQAALTVTSTTGTTGSTLALTTSGGSGSGTVTFTATTGTAGCTVSGSNLSFTSAGTCTVTATKAAADGFSAVSSSATTVTVNLATYTVTYSSNGGSAVTAGSFTSGGSIATAPAEPTRSGYTFAGWSATDGGSAITFPYSPGVTTNISLYAKWTLRFPYLSFNATDSSSYAGSGTSVTDTSFNGLAGTIPSGSYNSTTRTFNFAGGTSGSFANPSSKNPNLADGLSVQFMADVKATTADWSMVFDFGTNLNTNYVRAQFWNGPSESNRKLTLYMANGSGSYACNTEPGAISSGLKMYSIQVGPSVCSIKVNGVAATTTVGGTYASSIPTSSTAWTYRIAGNISGGSLATANIRALSFSSGATNIHSVVFDTNGGSGSMATQHGNAPVALTSNSFSRSGFGFNGWNTSADGSGTAYANLASYSFTDSRILYAQWASTDVLATFKSNYSGGASDTTQSIPLSTATALTSNTFNRTGYTFAGWTTNADGTGTSYANGQSVTLTGGITLYAKWTANSNTVTFNSNYGTPTTTTQSITTDTATNLTSNSFSRTGYTFAGWTANADGTGTSYTNSQSVTITGGLTLYAKWTANTYTVTYNYDNATGGNSTATADFTVGGTAITLPTPTRTGYTFAGWHSDSAKTVSVGNAGASYSPTTSLTLYAKWTANAYTITYSYNNATGGNSTATSSFTVDGTAITLPVPTRTGYTFDGWFEASNLSGSALGSTYSPTQSRTIYAKWTANTYTITYSYNNATGGNSTSTSSFTVDGTAITLPVPTRTGYTFSGWFENSGFTGSALGSTYSPTQSRTIYAKWTEITYTITYDRNLATGTPERATDTYTFTGGAVTLATVGSMARTGYTFDGWQVSGTTTKLSSTYTPTTNVTLEARWSAASYTITYFSNSGGTAPNADTYTTGNAALTLPTQGSMARTGYTFNGWSTTINDVSTKIAGSETSATLTTSAPVNLFALWTAINYTVTYCEESTCSNPAAFSGNVPVDANTYNIGNNVVVKANTGGANSVPLARTGYSFAGWTTDSDGGGTALLSGQTLTVQSANIRFYPQWSANTYTITYNTNGATGSPVRATDTYVTGNSATTLAGVGSMAKFGHTFSGWSADPMGSGQTSATTTSDVTLYAIWTVNSIQYT
jgi:uncharacterized repeat protein (TIGR02543 family)